MQVMLLLLFFFQIFTSCIPYKISTQDLPDLSKEKVSELDLERIQEARRHWLYTFVPRHRSQIYSFDLPHLLSWSLIGNDDDGIFGEEPTAVYRGEVSLGSAGLCFLRNPFHNFCFYVIGSAHHKNSELSILKINSSVIEMLHYQDQGSTDFAGPSSSFYMGFHGYKPFISLRFDYQRRFEAYLGWRSRGNFGIKLLPFKKIASGKS